MSNVYRETPARLPRFLVEKVATVSASCLYYWAIVFAHDQYLNVVWDYYGFSYWDADAITELFGIVLCAMGALCIPDRIKTASSSILLVLLLVVYIPSLAITLHLGSDSIDRHGALLLALCLSFCTAGLTSTKFTRNSQETDVNALNMEFPPKGMILFVLLCWVIIFGSNLVAFGSIMRIVGFGEEVYDQRAISVTSGYFAYSQTLFSTVFTPALIVIGLIRRKKFLVALGTLGAVFIFAITALRTILLLPVAIYLLYKLLRSSRLQHYAVSIALLALSIITALIAQFHDSGIVQEQLAALLVFRTIALPGLTLTQYYDLFSQLSYTYWSHVKIISLFVEAPEVYMGSGLWPGLGYIVGLHVYGHSDLNANANLYSGDGAAAAGEAGVIVIGIIFALFLNALDRCTRGWPSLYVVLFMLPFALSLSNSHLFTSLLSFGGIAWMMMFYFFKSEHNKLSWIGLQSQKVY